MIEASRSTCWRMAPLRFAASTRATWKLRARPSRSTRASTAALFLSLGLAARRAHGTVRPADRRSIVGGREGVGESSVEITEREFEFISHAPTLTERHGFVKYIVPSPLCRGQPQSRRSRRPPRLLT